MKLHFGLCKLKSYLCIFKQLATLMDDTKWHCFSRYCNHLSYPDCSTTKIIPVLFDKTDSILGKYNEISVITWHRKQYLLW